MKSSVGKTTTVQAPMTQFELHPMITRDSLMFYDKYSALKYDSDVVKEVKNKNKIKCVSNNKF